MRTHTTHGHDHDFKKGERGYNYYDCQWGTVLEDAMTTEGWEGWFKFRNDDGHTTVLNDERVVVAAVAKRYGYPPDPHPVPETVKVLCKGCGEPYALPLDQDPTRRCPHCGETVPRSH